MFGKTKTFLLLTFLVFSLFMVFPVYADYIFEDGFEDGYDPWTATDNTSPNVLEQSSTYSKQGTYSSHHDVSDDVTCYARKELGEYDTAYMRIYVYVDDSSFTNTQRYVQFMEMRGEPTYQKTVGVGVTKNNALLLWWYDTAGHAADSSTTLTMDYWHCVEVKWVSHASSGEVRVYLDDNEVEDLTQTGLDTSARNVEAALAGQSQCYLGAADYADFYVDCVVVDDAYIGPIEEVSEYTEIFSESVAVSESGDFKGTYSRMWSESVAVTSVFAYLGRSTMHSFTETVTVEEAAGFWCEKLHLFSELVHIGSEGVFQKELLVIDVYETFMEAAEQEGAVTVWKEKLVTFSESHGFLGELGKWISLVFLGEETAAATVSFDKWISLYTVFSETINILVDETMQGEFAFIEVLTVWETIRPEESSFTWRELQRTFQNPVSVTESAEKFIALAVTASESIAVGSVDLFQRALWFTTTETLHLASILTTLAESLVTSLEFLENIVVTPAETFTPELAVAVPSINEVAGLAALAFIIALAAVALVVSRKD